VAEAGSAAPADAAVRGLLSSARVIPPVLCYHKIERRRELGVTRLSPRRFATQVEALAGAGWQGLSLREFTAVLRGERPLRERELLITFDDAYRGLRDFAFPVLRDVGFRAVCFVITDYAGRLNRWDVAYGGRRFAHLAWRDIERWSDSGIAFESHSATHPRLSWVDDRRLFHELHRSRVALESALGAAPTSIAYPFAAVDDRIANAAARCGYSVGFVSGAPWRGDAFRVPRSPVHSWSPRLPAVGPLGVVERLVSNAAARCSIGTAIWQRLASINGVSPLEF
jgi:peptidoglycan/xylan/chitin deacetylase (PgdA/CDA1 family)